MTVVDCFTFYNETELLRKRLEYLSPKVDKFVLVESTKTFRGNDKSLVYFQDLRHREDFAEWKDKIINVVVDDNPEGDDPWAREKHQRNCITRGLEHLNLEPDDFVMMGDVDEIPHLDWVGVMPEGAVVVTANMYAFEYSLKWTQVVEPWFGTVMARYKLFEDERATPQFFRDNRWKFPYAMNAGWHFSSFGSTDHVFNKIKNFSHCHDDSVAPVTKEQFDDHYKNGRSTDGRFHHQATPEIVIEQLPDVLKTWSEY
ncbi:hypothetical protein DSLPV1_042 [Dishui lake phycodnavirus 1]|uniref:hypothetical protein n=1 Tax=Dishui lake phycodnavirus 1 TaxID=2079134 RepID=UPI000CD6B98A|nr:hypothetical protein C5Y57_gp042 [Dishui lake phycodnavirus 1]AUT19013.1 hypothetical protein DSLPV1_042 [Dishui lake phycodnavirus 1]